MNMTPEEQTEYDNLKEGLYDLLHAMQSGVKFDQESGSDDGSPKHLRVGVNAAMVEHGALVELLIEKGVITKLEIARSMYLNMQREVSRYEHLLSAKFNKPVTLI